VTYFKYLGYELATIKLQQPLQRAPHLLKSVVPKFHCELALKRVMEITTDGLMRNLKRSGRRRMWMGCTVGQRYH
jgi:hypothetical protein